MKSLAKKYNTGSSTIRRRLVENDINIRSVSEALKISDKKYRVDLPYSICEEYKSGETLINLGKKYNCHSSTVRSILIKYGVELRSKLEVYKIQYDIDNENYTFDVPYSICEEYKNGSTLECLSKKYNHTCSFIQDKLEKYGIEVDKIGGIEWRRKVSATLQGITYDEWEDFAAKKLYCLDWNEEIRESNREKYGRRCFLTGLPEEENIDKNGKQIKLSVHHYDMDKGQGCNGKKWKLVPLCMEWHGKVHNELWEARIIWLLENVWN